MRPISKITAVVLSLSVALQTFAPAVYAQADDNNLHSEEQTQELYENKENCGNITGSASIGGTPLAGGVLSCTANVEKGPEQSELAYQWQYSSDGKDFEDIKGAVNADYRVEENKKGAYRVIVSDSTKKYTGTIVSPELTNETGAVIDGGVIPGDIASVKPVFVAEEDMPKLHYVWQQSQDNSSFSDIADNSTDTYTISEDMTGKYIRAGISLDGKSYVYSDSHAIADLNAAAAAYDTSSEGTTADLYDADVLHLSDIKDNSCLVYQKIGYSNLKYNTNMGESKISLYVDGKKTYFDKGFTAHAQSELVFKLDGLRERGFNSFFTYLGVDSAAGGNGNGVKIFVYTSDVCNTSNPSSGEWKLVKETGVLKGNSNCQEITLDIREKTNINYIRIVFDENGGNGSDHSVAADIQVRKEVYDRVFQNYSFIKTLDEYDRAIEEYGSNYEQLANDSNYLSLIHQRKIVENAGYNLLQDYANRSDEYNEAIKWFFESNEALELFISGGPPRGNNYLQAVKVMLDLYIKYPEDVKKPLYLRMMAADALTNSERLGTWYGLDTTCDPVKRYGIFKDLHEKGYIVKNVFDNLEVAEMRYVFEDTISDEEIEWLNFYHRKYKLNNMHPDITEFNVNRTGPGAYQYISYGLGYNYDKDIYYAEDKREEWVNKYHLEKRENDKDDDDFSFGDLYNTGHRLWIVFQEGSVCGGIAQTGAHILTVNGMPAHHIGQPGHAAFIYYGYDGDATQPEGGQGIWRLGNDVGGWTKSYTYNANLPLNWGHQSWRNTYNISYIFLIQAALNDYKNYEEAEKYVKTADYMQTIGKYDEAVDLYKKALEVQSIDYNAWIGLYDTYVAKKATDEEFMNLAKDASEKLTYYPTPMFDYAITAIRPKIHDSVMASEVNGFVTDALLKAKEATEENTLQYKECRLLANYTLGAYDTGVADFSFDGEKAGTIVLTGQFANGVNQFLYSIDGENWINAGDDAENRPNTEKKLTEEELSKVNAEDDIRVKLLGANTFHTIDIVDAEIPNKYYMNDNENRIMGVDALCEYSDDAGETWKPITEEMEFPGTRSIMLRTKATGKTLRSEPAIYNFTVDSSDETVSYIDRKRIQLIDYSSEDTGRKQFASNTIDGNGNTVWHTDWGGGDEEIYLTYKFDKPVFLSAIDYTPGPERNGRFTRCEIYTSTDNETWVLVGSQGWLDNTDKKRISLSVTSAAQYVKIVGKKTNNNAGSAGLIEFFENPTAEGKKLMCIVMGEKPDKTEYLVGDTLDTTGMIVYGIYDDLMTGIINLSSLNFSKTVFDKPGNETILITYPGFTNPDIEGADTIPLEVVVKENKKKPLEINVEKLPDKTRYFVGDEFTTDGLTVTARYEDDTKGYIFDYTVDDVSLDTDGTKTVNIRWGELTTSFDINVIKQVNDIKVQDNPDKMQYLVGESFDSTGMEVVAEFDDNTSAVIDEDRYIINSKNFSDFSGSRFVDIVLKTREDIKTQFGVTVLPNVTDGYLKFDISEDSYTCNVSGFESDKIPEEVVIPDSVTVGGKEYAVTGIASEAFDGANINSIDFPASVKDIQSRAFSNCYGIEEVYFIDHTSVENLNVADDAFEYTLEENKASIFTANTDIMNELLEKEGIKGKFMPGNFTKEINEIEITPPDRTKYNIGDELDLHGFAVYADLSGNGQKTLIPHNFYELDYSTEFCGTATVTVRIKETEIKKTFTITVDAARPIIRVMPAAGLYGENETINPLTVEAYTTDKGIISYQWYKSKTTEPSPLEDTLLEGETNPSYTPKETGYYYVAVTNSDGRDIKNGMTIHSSVVSVMIGGFEASIGSIGYKTLQDAIDAAKKTAENIIYINKDIELNAPVRFNLCEFKILSKSGHVSEGTDGEIPEITNRAYTIKRGPGIPANQPMFILPYSAIGPVTFENIILDGGAEWSRENDVTNSGITANAPIIKTDGELHLGQGAVLCNNFNTSSGGAVHVYNSGKIFIDGAEIKNNYSGSYGGAIYAANRADIRFQRGSIRDNYALNNGAAICVDNYSTIAVDNGEISNNYSKGNGVLWLGNGKVTINGGTIADNICNYSSVHCIYEGTIELNGGIVKSPEKQGNNNLYSVYSAGTSKLSIGYPESIEGAIYADSINKVTFTGNTRGKELYFVLGGNRNNKTEFADVTLPEFADDDKDSIRISGKTAYLSPDNRSVICLKNTDLKYDVDGDKYVTGIDAFKLLKKISGIISSALANEDMNNDGKLNILDVAEVLKFLVY